MNGLKKVLYRLADLLLLNKGVPRSINGISIRFPARWSRYFEESYEGPNVAFFKSHAKNGMSVIDIGAHIGVMSVSIVKLSGPDTKVYSFEPTPSTMDVFKEVIRLNHMEKQIIPLPDAISDSRGKVRFYISSIEGNNSNTLIKYRGETAAEQMVEVNTISIDEFKSSRNIKKLDFIKIDAEGAELKVLRGAKNTFLQDRPIAILALHPNAIVAGGDTLEQIWDFISLLKYTVVYNSKELNKESFCTISDLFDVHLTPQ
jgi:FkbM family methyltransferase